MSRRTRFEYHANRNPLGNLFSRAKQAIRKAANSHVVPKKTFIYQGGKVQAHTRSQARALIKQALGIKQRGRLPRGFLIAEKGSKKA